MAKVSDITIVGGGVLGMLTAFEFSRQGARVTLLEKNDCGQESSWAGGGILLPIYPWRQHEAITQLVLQSIKLYPSLIADIHHRSGIDPEFLCSGMLVCKNPDYSAALAWGSRYGVRMTNPPLALTEIFAPCLDAPLWLPEICQVRNPRLIKALYASLCQMGVEIIPQCELTGLTLQQSRVLGIQTTLGYYPVEQLVLTTGAWSGELWRTLFASNPVVMPNIAPAKGQMLLFAAEPNLLSTMVLDGAHYLIPRQDGGILVGSTVEYVGFDKTVHQEARQQLEAFAYATLPALRNYPVQHHWAGLRPGTETGIPYIGIHPEIDNLSINAGHFRNGLTLAPASAELLVNLLLKRPTAISPIPYQFESLH